MSFLLQGTVRSATVDLRPRGQDLYLGGVRVMVCTNISTKYYENIYIAYLIHRDSGKGKIVFLSVMTVIIPKQRRKLQNTTRIFTSQIWYTKTLKQDK